MSTPLTLQGSTCTALTEPTIDARDVLKSFQMKKHSIGTHVPPMGASYSRDLLRMNYLRLRKSGS